MRCFIKTFFNHVTSHLVKSPLTYFSFILSYSISLLILSSRRPSGLRKTNVRSNSLAHRTTWLRSDF
ncbi:hypothetical protein PTB13_04920 [Bacillus sp. MHSD17]|nr:hypothetical protein [Bacillus sp. MHSD17]